MDHLAAVTDLPQPVRSSSCDVCPRHGRTLDCDLADDICVYRERLIPSRDRLVCDTDHAYLRTCYRFPETNSCTPCRLFAQFACFFAVVDNSDRQGFGCAVDAVQVRIVSEQSLEFFLHSKGSWRACSDHTLQAGEFNVMAIAVF